MCKPLIAYQIYSAREDAEKDLCGVLRQLKQMGYDGVEFAGFYGHTAEEVAGMLQKTSLQAISSHVAFSLIEQDMFGVIAYHLEIGCQYIAIPYLDDTM
ncbi:MAG: sugar phosphate isomerase/epimerase, partial [Clostridia bacterium]